MSGWDATPVAHVSPEDEIKDNATSECSIVSKPTCAAMHSDNMTRMDRFMEGYKGGSE